MSASTKVTVRLPDPVVEMNLENGKLMGKNQTDAMAYAIKLTALILKAREEGNAIVLHNKTTDQYREIVIV